MTGTALAALVACGGRAGQHIDTACYGVFAASDDRSAWAYTAGDALTVVAGARRTQLGAGLGCGVRDAQWMYVSPRGATVALYGTRGNMEGDLWGHAGRHISAACVIDVATAQVHAMAGTVGDDYQDVAFRGAGDRILMWRPDVPVDGLVVLDGDRATSLPLPAGRCQVAATGPDAAVAVCMVTAGTAVRHVRLGATPGIDGPDTTLPAIDVGAGGGSALSRDGRVLIAWGTVWAAEGAPQRNRVVAIELATGKRVFTYDRTERGEITAVELDPRGSGDLLIARAYEDGDESIALIERVGPLGTVRRERRLRDPRRALFWTEPDGLWAVESCGADHVTM